MIKTKKAGVLHGGKIRKAGELLSLSAQDEERLVREGWATFAEAWPATQDTPNASAPEDEPKTDAPEELEPRRPRSRRK